MNVVNGNHNFFFNIIDFPTFQENEFIKKHTREFIYFGKKTDVEEHCLQKSSMIESYKNFYKISLITGAFLPNKYYENIYCGTTVNHFKHIKYLGRKDEYHFRVQELKARKGNDFVDFYPETYLLTNDIKTLNKIWTKHKFWIVKPRSSSKAKNIEIRNSSERYFPPYVCIVQEYIERPFLINNKKFGLRYYLLISNHNPLTMFIHKRGICLFCTTDYNINNHNPPLTMFLSNLEINYPSADYVTPEYGNEKEDNSKWSKDFFLDYIQKTTNRSAESVDKLLNDVCTKAVITGFNKTRELELSERSCYRGYELLGVDILITEDFKPYVMEINVSPSLSGKNCSLDYAIKSEVFLDTLHLISIYESNDSMAAYYSVVNDSITKERRKHVTEDKINPWDSPVIADFEIIRDYLNQNERKRNYSLTYPSKEDYKKYREYSSIITYEDIVLHKWIELPDNKKQEIIKEFSSHNVKLKSLITNRICYI